MTLDCQRQTVATITLGNYEITKMSDGRIWIGPVGDGEGGMFDEADVAAAIDDFYREHF